MKKKKIIIALLIVIIIEIIAIFISVIKVMDPKPKIPQVNVREKIKEIEEKNNTEEKQENLTPEYIEYQKLTEEEKQELEVIPRKEKVDEKELDNIIEEQKEIEIPSYFNLKDKISLKVENQESYGICWAFASLKTLETYLQLHGNEYQNLSEIKVDYIMSNLMYGNRNIHDGGSFDTFEEYLMRTGPKLQKENEYHDYEENEYENFLEEENITRVTETINFPAVNLFDENGQKSQEQIKTEKEKLRKAVKTHIMENGAVYAVIKRPTDINHYCTTACLADHAITIVGWDDNYKKENFITQDGKMPENDGAYIALNSWGEEWGDKGYFYISYEDQTVEREMSGITSTSMEKTQSLEKITSPKIKQILDSEYGYSYIDNTITNLTIKRITNLDLQENEIEDKDLESLNILSNLNYLNLSKNKLENIETLNIDKLATLDLSQNNIKDISNINLKNLKVLTLNENKNITGIEKLKNIEVLELENSNIKNIDLTNLKKLTRINLSNNPIENIKLKEKINAIELKNSNIKSIKDLKNLKKVVDIDLSENNIETLDGLENIEEINYLNLSNNKIKNIEKINDSITGYIDLSNNKIENIEPINKVRAYTVNLENNNIKDISKFKNDNILYINLSKNPEIKDYSSLKNTKSVILRENNISNLEILEPLVNAKLIDISNNKIIDITPLNELKNLKELYLDENKNITGTLNNNIETLSIINCNLTDIDISKLNNLINIDISGNKINIANLINKTSEKLFVSAEELELSKEEFEYIINERENLNKKQIYIALSKPTIKINVKTPYDLKNLEWLEINNNTKIENGTIENNILNIINTNEPIKMELDNIIKYNIYSPTIIFNAN